MSWWQITVVCTQCAVGQTGSQVKTKYQEFSCGWEFVCGPDTYMSSCLSKRSLQIVTLLSFGSSISFFGTIFAHTFHVSRSSGKIYLTVSLTMFTCSSMLLTVSRRFSRTIWRDFAMFLQFCLLLAVLISLRLWHFLFPQKNVSPTCKLLFSS